MDWRRLGLCLTLLPCVAVSLSSEAATPDAATTTIQSKVRVVVVDVVVTDVKGAPVPGLHKEDFQLLENGKPQTFASFEEHTGTAPTVIKLPALPPHVYTNLPLTRTTDSVYVLLLDALNTPIADQSFVHKEMLKYLATIRPGTRVAIFTLSSRLRMIQGVTTDSTELLALLNDKKGIAGPHQSPILPSGVESQADQEVVNFLIENQGGPESASVQNNLDTHDTAGTTDPAAAVDPIEAMKQFLSDSEATETESRVGLTLRALQQIGRYLSDIPGRKNLIWFSGSFPTGILPNTDVVDPFSVVDDFQKEVRKTAQLLAADQVAIYPVGAEGLAPDAVFQANGSPVSQKRGLSQLGDTVQQMRADSVARDSGHNVMDDLAKTTGGQAFYNTNGLGDVLARVVDDGSHYYTLSYAPTDTNMDGKFRRIQVNFHGPKYKLAYRSGYYALDAETARSAGRALGADPLLPLMGRNLPDFSQIIYEVRVLPETPQPGPGAPRLGGNTAMTGPFTRYRVDFAIWAPGIKLDATPEGRQRGAVEIMVIAYDRGGKPLNFASGATQVLLTPDAYARVLQRGLQMHEEIDVPKGDIYLRTGVYDLKGSTAGTLGVALHGGPAPTTAAAK